LGADMAAFSNYSGGAEGASKALTKALLGEREMLKMLDVPLLEADILEQMKLDEMKGIRYENERMAKTMATWNLILKRTTNQQGAFGREQEGFANKLKEMKARLEDVSAVLGEKLVPIALKFV